MKLQRLSSLTYYGLSFYLRFSLVSSSLLLVMDNLANTGTLGGKFLGLAGQTSAFYDGMVHDIVNTVNGA